VRWAAASWARARGRARTANRAGVASRPAAASPERWAAEIAAGLARRAGSPRGTISYDDAIAVICQATGWPVGHVWVDSATGWRSSGAWHNHDDASRAADYAALREATAITDLGSGRGIVAAVLHLESCRFLPGLEGLGSPFRQQPAAQLGLSGVVGVPVHAVVGGHRKVTAVLEFVTAGEVEPDGALAQALLDVAGRARRRIARKPAPAAAPTAVAAPARPKPLDIELPGHLAG